MAVYDAGELDDGRPYLVMSYADQGTLADRLEVEGLTVGQSMEVVRQVGLGLQALHDHGVLHRDVKPANVLFRTPDPASGVDRGDVRAMLGDLGLGKALDMSSRLTMIAGTPTFVAPEQAQGERLDGRADQYSLGRAHLPAASPGGRRTPTRAWPRPPHRASRPACRRRAESSPSRSSRSSAAPSRRTASSAGRTSRRTSRPCGRPSATTCGRGCRQPWLPLDPELTQPGRPADVAPRLEGTRRTDATAAASPSPTGGRVRGHRGPGQRVPRSGTRCTAATATPRPCPTPGGSCSVTVPSDWRRVVASEGWRPPHDRGRYAALSAGTAKDWASADSEDEGIFVGILPGTELPTQVPQHPECRRAESRRSPTWATSDRR